MSKELEALERIIGCSTIESHTQKWQEDYKLVETALKREDSIEITAIDIEQDNKELCKENKKLKQVLEIIKEKDVDVRAIKHAIRVAACNKATTVNAKTKDIIKPYIYYNASRPKSERLTEEQFDLLKEVLKNENN